MNPLPPLQYATVVGRFMVFNVDSADDGGEPDVAPAVGGGTIKSSVQHLLVSGSEPPVTVSMPTLQFEFDEEGYVVDAGTKTRGLTVIAPSVGASPETFRYRVDFSGSKFPGFDFDVVAGVEVDLTRAALGLPPVAVEPEPEPEPEPEGPDAGATWLQTFTEIVEPWVSMGSHLPPGARPDPAEEPVFQAILPMPLRTSLYRFDFVVEVPTVPVTSQDDFFAAQLMLMGGDEASMVSVSMSIMPEGAGANLSVSRAGGTFDTDFPELRGGRYSIRRIGRKVHLYHEGTFITSTDAPESLGEAYVGIIVQSNVGGGVTSLSYYAPEA